MNITSEVKQLARIKTQAKKQAKIMNDTSKSFKFRLNALMLSGDRPAKFWI